MSNGVVMAGVDQVKASIHINPDRLLLRLDQVHLLVMGGASLVEYLINEQDDLSCLVLLRVTFTRVDSVCDSLE